MLKALWFAVKIGCLIAVAVWVAERPGHIRLEWLDYVVTIQMGLFLLLCLITILLSIFIYRVLTSIISMPSSYRRYLELKRKDKGYRALTLGLSAVAAGDRKMAVYQAHRASKLLPEEHGLPNLLSAQAARLDGREEDAAREFVALLENKDASFLGVRGLLQSALDNKDYDSARKLIDKALALHPKQIWILSLAREIYVHVQDWDAARDIIKRIKKEKSIDQESAAKDLSALYLAQSEDESRRGLSDQAFRSIKKAQKSKPDFAPVHLAMAAFYRNQDDVRLARKCIEKAWKLCPHDAYVLIWTDLADKSDALKYLKHMSRLTQINGLNALAQREAGRAALHAGLWGEAKEYFKAAENIEPSAELYHLWAELTEKSGGDENEARAYLEKALSAPQDKTWICKETGQVYSQWSAILPPDNFFNTLEWSSERPLSAGQFLSYKSMSSEASLVEAPS